MKDLALKLKTSKLFSPSKSGKGPLKPLQCNQNSFKEVIFYKTSTGPINLITLFIPFSHKDSTFEPKRLFSYNVVSPVMMPQIFKILSEPSKSCFMICHLDGEKSPFDAKNLLNKYKNLQTRTS
jgi:hypothetical protein